MLTALILEDSKLLSFIMDKESRLSWARLISLLSYNPYTGQFTWIKGRGHMAAGSMAGSVNAQGYITISINGDSFLAHRLAWYYVHRQWPIKGKQIDHKNRVRCDNRIANLHVVSATQNSHNRGATSRSSSGIMGVCWEKDRGNWRAHICIRGRDHNLGNYDNLYQAVWARHKAEIKAGYNEVSLRNSDAFRWLVSYNERYCIANGV